MTQFCKINFSTDEVVCDELIEELETIDGLNVLLDNGNYVLIGSENKEGKGIENSLTFPTPSVKFSELEIAAHINNFISELVNRVLYLKDDETFIHNIDIFTLDIEVHLKTKKSSEFVVALIKPSIRDISYKLDTLARTMEFEDFADNSIKGLATAINITSQKVLGRNLVEPRPLNSKDEQKDLPVSTPTNKKILH